MWNTRSGWGTVSRCRVAVVVSGGVVVVVVGEAVVVVATVEFIGSLGVDVVAENDETGVRVPDWRHLDGLKRNVEVRFAGQGDE